MGSWNWDFAELAGEGSGPRGTAGRSAFPAAAEDNHIRQVVLFKLGPVDLLQLLDALFRRGRRLHPGRVRQRVLGLLRRVIAVGEPRHQFMPEGVVRKIAL